MSELTYENEDGDTVFTSLYLQNRRTCCKTNCLHCPYGCTIKNNPLEFKSLSEDNLTLAQNLIDGDSKKEEVSVSASLLASAFGSPKKKKPITLQTMDQYLFVLLKDEICGLIKKGNLQASELFLGKHFKNQELSIDIVNSYI